MNNIVSIDSKQLISINSNQELMNKWLKFSELTNENTKNTYIAGVDKFIEYIENQLIVTPTRDTMLDFKAYLISKYSKGSAYTYLSGLKSFYKFLEFEDISKDITRNVKLPQIPRGHKKDSLTLNQISDLYLHLHTSTLLETRNNFMINLMLMTGLRTCEIVNADISDIQTKEGKKVLYIKGKGHIEKDSFVVLEDDLLKLMDLYLNKRGKYTDNEPLFISLSNNNHGGRISSISVRKIIKNLYRESGIDSKRITTHSLRHTAITLSLIGGAKLQESSEMARHVDINTTVRYVTNLNRLNNSPESKIQNVLRENITDILIKN